LRSIFLPWREHALAICVAVSAFTVLFKCLRVGIYALLFTTGWMWNKIESTLAEWEAEVTIRISGRGRIGADGLVSSCA